VTIRDAISCISEQQAFAEPAKLRDLFTTCTAPSTDNTCWAFTSLSVNIGRQHNRSIDPGGDFALRVRPGYLHRQHQRHAHAEVRLHAAGHR
jgi:hypothetical protein